jgi:hypothetical protein
MRELLSSINWTVVTPIVTMLGGVVVTAWLKERLEKRPKLVTWFGEFSYFTLKSPPETPTGTPPIQVRTHQIVVRNNGRKSATNVRIPHAVLPEYRVHPSVKVSEEPTHGGGTDIVIPTLVPGEEISISYLYYAPIPMHDVNPGPVKSDEGFATSITMLRQRQYPNWANLSALAFFVIGVTSSLYFIALGGWHLLLWLMSD